MPFHTHTRVASMYDSTGNDLFVGTTTISTMTTGATQQIAFDFKAVVAYASSGGTDRAELYDSYTNDTFEASGKVGTLTSSLGKSIQVQQFGQVTLVGSTGINTQKGQGSFVLVKRGTWVMSTTTTATVKTTDFTSLYTSFQNTFISFDSGVLKGLLL